MPFRDWLLAHTGDDTPIGDLARDAASDPGWQGDCPTTLRRSMDRYPACPAAHQALAEAAHHWRAEEITL